MTNLLPILIGIILNSKLNLADNNVTDLQNATHDDSKEYNASSELYEFVLLDESNVCARKCQEGMPPMTCRYKFVVEWYYTLSKACYDCPSNSSDCFRMDCIPGDGNQRSVVAINRNIPGPLIEVCQGDEIVVDVDNHLMDEATTMHWHGQHQMSSPYMDGVPYVTQCPILPGNSFRYIFRADNAGTHFWHSHIGMQRADGAYGPLIVHTPEENDPHAVLYDFDLPAHIIMINDWTSEAGLDKFLHHYHSDGDNKPITILVNGLGRFTKFDKNRNQTLHSPAARFKVEQGYRYRFRIINAGFLNCPIEVSVDNHTIKVVSTDGTDIVPVETTSLVTYAGERFDIILSADQPKDLYWIRFKGLLDGDERYTKAFQVAVLEYQGLDATINDYPDSVPTYENSHREGKQVNVLNIGTEDNNKDTITIPELESLQNWDHVLKEKPDVKFYIAYDFYEIDNDHFYRHPYYGFFNMSESSNRVLTPQFNHISMKMPHVPLLSQRDEIHQDMFCNEDTMRSMNCSKNYCECPHVLQVPLHSVVELVFVDEGFAYNANHPLHLHGNSFRVVGMERLGESVSVEDVKKLDKKGLIKRNLQNPPIKDTVTVPDGGYTVVRFQADNPGYWLFHCHIEFHSEIGMSLVFKVGEHSDMLPVPPNFPKCGDYLPQLIINKRNCSRNKFLAEIEKYLFGEDCSSSSPSTSKLPRWFVTGVIVTILLIQQIL